MAPPTPFTLLFDDDADGAGVSAGAGPSLPAGPRGGYGGDWQLPVAVARPYTYVNFAMSHDGKVSFAVPGHAGGGDVSGFDGNDRWLMGLLRARADAVLVGDSTLRVEPEHLWTAEYVCPEDAEAFADLRRVEGRTPVPATVFLSLTGDLNADADVFTHPEVHVVVATTRSGVQRARGIRHAGPLDVLDLGVDAADPAALVAALFERFGVRTLLCEGGPRVYGSMLAAGQVDEEFVTWCPTVIGNPADAPRPSLVEGVGFAPADAPRLRPVSLRRAGDHLYARSRRVRSAS